MTSPNRHPKRHLLLGRIGGWASIGLLLTVGCQNDERIGEIADLVPDMDVEVIRRLLDDDDPELASFARERGYSAMKDLRQQLNGAISARDSASWVETRSTILPLTRRLARSMDSAFGFGSHSQAAEFHATLSWSDSRWIRGVGGRVRSTLKSSSLSVDEKVAIVSAAVDSLWLAGARHASLWHSERLIGVLSSAGRRDEAKSHAESLLVRARRMDDVFAQCHLLGSMAHLNSYLGAPAETEANLDEALRLAVAHRLPYMTTRACRFLASFHRSAGRFGLAVEYLDDGYRYCREFRGSPGIELSLLDYSLAFHEHLGCWEYVWSHLPRATILSESPSARATQERRRGTYLTVTGQIDSARAIFARVRDAHRGAGAADAYPSTLLHQAVALVNADRPDLALPLIDEAIPLCSAANLHRITNAFVMMRAHTLHLLERHDEAEQALLRYERLTRENGLTDALFRVFDHAIRSGIALARDDSSAASDEARQALAELSRHLGAMQPSAEAYVQIGQLTFLRDVLHAAHPDVESRYRTELLWQRLPRSVGVGAGAPRPVRSVASRDDARARIAPAMALEAQADRIARDLRSWSVASGGIHVLYRVESDHVQRWVLDAGNLRGDTIDIQRDSLRTMVNDVLRGLPRGAGGDASARELPKDLHRLATLLIPREILDRETSPPGTLLITPHDCLSMLPFSVLDVGDLEYVPLIARWNVARFRSAGSEKRGPAEASGLIVADPLLSESLARRYPDLRRLTASRGEAEHVLAAAPGATLLRGAMATKQAIVSDWTRQRMLYVASHVIREHDRPYLTFIPTSPALGESSPPRTSDRIDLLDIRSADLSACEMVVLSGCASGVPYVGLELTAPSLADAFIDSGAKSVVSTFWRIGDREADALMRAFITEWGLRDRDVVAALSSVQRSLWESGEERAADWAAFGVQVGDIPDS